MTLTALQGAVVDALQRHYSLLGNVVPVLAEDEGNVVAERDANLAKSLLAVTVGAARFTPTSRDSGVIVGTASMAVTVFERPSRNRIGQADSMRAPKATDEAERVACALHLLPLGGGVLVFAGIGPVERTSDGEISRTVTFETLATLTGE